MDPSVYRNISQDLEFQEEYFDVYKIILFSMCTISNIVVFVTCWIIKSTPSQVFVVYKYALTMNILLPALLNNFIGYFMQPYLPLPYFVILVLGPLNQGYIFTEICTLLSVLIALVCIVSLWFTFVYNYFIVCRISLYSTSYVKTKLAFIFTVIAIAVVFNIYFIVEGFSYDFPAFMKEMYKTEPNMKKFVDRYSCYIFNIQNSISIPILLSESAAAIIVVGASCFILIYRARAVIEDHRSVVSKTTYNIQCIILRILIAYVALFGFVLAAPMFFSGLGVYFKWSFLKQCALSSLFLFAPPQTISLCIALLHLLSMRPYRRQFIRLFNKYFLRKRKIRSSCSLMKSSVSINGSIKRVNRSVITIA